MISFSLDVWDCCARSQLASAVKSSMDVLSASVARTSVVGWKSEAPSTIGLASTGNRAYKREHAHGINKLAYVHADTLGVGDACGVPDLLPIHEF
jgi:hypothetical protein